MRYQTIHITGASGAGTTTLAKAICARYGHTHLDSDDFFWEDTDPPYTRKRAMEDRQTLLSQALGSAERWVLSGSLTGWGDLFIPLFELVVYVHTPTDIRLQRLHERELRQFGARILPDGDMFEEHKKFLEWASQYDDGPTDMRSAAHHREWLTQIPCPILRLDGTAPAEENLERVVAD